MKLLPSCWISSMKIRSDTKNQYHIILTSVLTSSWKVWTFDQKLVCRTLIILSLSLGPTLDLPMWFAEIRHLPHFPRWRRLHLSVPSLLPVNATSNWENVWHKFGFFRCLAGPEADGGWPGGGRSCHCCHASFVFEGCWTYRKGEAQEAKAEAALWLYRLEPRGEESILKQQKFTHLIAYLYSYMIVNCEYFWIWLNM